MAQLLLLFRTPVISIQGQTNVDKHDNAEFFSIYHHTIFDENPFIKA